MLRASSTDRHPPHPLACLLPALIHRAQHVECLLAGPELHEHDDDQRQKEGVEENGERRAEGFPYHGAPDAYRSATGLGSRLGVVQVQSMFFLVRESLRLAMAFSTCD